MTMTACRECKKEISTEAQTCPHCGTPNPTGTTPPTAPATAKKSSKAGLLFLVLAAVVVVGYCNQTLDDAGTGIAAPPLAPPSAASGPVLEVQSWSWSHEPDARYANVRGEVKNISDSPLSNVQAVASVYGEGNVFITSDDAFIEFNPIMPGQISPFRVMVRWNPAMKTAKLDMKELTGRQIPFRVKDSSP